MVAANGYWLWWTIALCVWMAGRKGHSFFGYFLFSLVFFPLALLSAYLVQDRNAPTLV